MPGFMSQETVHLVVKRIREHCENHHLMEIYVNLHGGEPMLYGLERTRDLLEHSTELLSPIKIHWGIQTNGILITPEWVELFDQYEMHLGLSLDGTASANDAYRVDHRGRGSHARVLEGAQHLMTPAGRRIFSGILAVINPYSDSLEVFHHLVELQPCAIDFLLPHGNWDNIPAIKRSDPLQTTPFADWLIPIFDEWFHEYADQVQIRTFEEIIEHLAGGPGRLETIGLQPVSLICVATNGDLEGVDTLKSIPGEHILGFNLKDHSFDDVLAHPKYVLRQLGLNALCETCRSCPIVNTCGGGYLPHRWGKGNQYLNPSVFCADLMKLIYHIQDIIVTECQVSPFDKNENDVYVGC